MTTRRPPTDAQRRDIAARQRLAEHPEGTRRSAPRGPASAPPTATPELATALGLTVADLAVALAVEPPAEVESVMAAAARLQAITARLNQLSQAPPGARGVAAWQAQTRRLTAEGEPLSSTLQAFRARALARQGRD